MKAKNLSGQTSETLADSHAQAVDLYKDLQARGYQEVWIEDEQGRNLSLRDAAGREREVMTDADETSKPSELLVLARRLYARRTSGTTVPYKMLDPNHIAGDCHNNADLWARDNPGWKSVRGWLVLSDRKNVVQFNPHSVVEDSDGARVDPTPEARATQRLPFLPHEARTKTSSVSWKAIG